MLKPGIRMSVNERKIVSESIGHILCGLLTRTLSLMASSEDRCFVQSDMSRLAFAMAAYRADRGSYPAKLTYLSPKYIAVVPKDRFNDGDLHDSLQAGGYLLYSVGPNGQDDGGKGIEDRKRGESWDDIAIRIVRP